jgi:uncharacterized protein YgbK (DUF1537 family)
MKIGVIADDFTGASDIGLTLAEGGLRTTQYVGVPSAPAGASVDAGVVSLISRTAPVAEAVAQSLAVGEWLLAQGAGRIVVAGGETFGAVISALGVTALEIGPRLAPGVPALRTDGGAEPLCLALKSGNFGHPDFFADAMSLMQSAR